LSIGEDVPWPNDVVTRTVYGTYLTAAGAGAQGRVTFTPSSRILDSDDAVIIEDAIVATLSNAGYFEVDLPTTDNDLLTPKSWTYEVNIRLFGVKPQRFKAILPYGDGSDVDIINDISTSTSTFTQGVGAPDTVQGPIGPRGPGTLTGIGLPVYTDGFDGDIYIDTDTGYYYGPKAAGEWPGVPFFTAGANQRHIHTQSAVSATWTITHLLGGRPSVSVVDSSGTVVVGEVRYDSNTVVTVLFTTPFSGYAYLT
jgi:hypothetical protein